MMRVPVLALFIALACLTSQVHSKTVFRRTDKISENFKQLDLLPEEIDPNVAPPVKQELVETIDPAEAAATGTVDISVNDAIDLVEEPSAAVADEVVDEAANEVDDVLDDVTEAPIAAAVAAAVAVATTTAKPVTAKPTKAAVATSANNTNDPQGLSKYCKCTDSHCDCCRSIGLPILPVRSDACAKLTYLGNEKMSVSLKYGDLTLVTRTISGKRARPICVGLPGGGNEFCGRIYGLSKGKEDFKACLGFELRSDDEVEAALRVSCFRFGPGGLRVAEAEPLPSELNKDEDDDDDIFGFGAGGDDDDDDDYDADEADNEEEDEEDEDDEEYADAEDTEAPEDADYGGFSLGGLLAELADDEEDTTVGNKPAAAAVTVAADSTRTVTANHKVMMQSKNVTGKEAVTAEVAGAAISAADAIVSAEEAAVTAAATPAPAVSDIAATTVKSKKAKKNKKKKTNRETDYAFEILNGILDFFN